MKDERTWFEKDLDEIRDTFDYRLADLEFELTENIASLMLERGINKAELARRLGTSRAAVTMFLRDGSNLTLKRMLRVADALDAELAVRIAPRETMAFSQHPPSESILIRGVTPPRLVDPTSFFPSAGFSDEYPLTVREDHARNAA